VANSIARLPSEKEVQPSAQCLKILRHAKIPAEYNSDNTSAKFKDISGQLPVSLLDISATAREQWWMNQELLQLRWGNAKYISNGRSE
jgi:hypothetical protein